MGKNKNQKRNAKKIAAAVIVSLILCASAAFMFYKPQIYNSIIEKVGGQMQLSADGSESATTKVPLHMRSGAGKCANVICTLPKGTTVTVISSSESGWTKVKTSDGLVGWCSSPYLGSASTHAGSSAVSKQASSSGKAVQTNTKPEVKWVSLENSAKPLYIDVSLAKQKVQVMDAKGCAVEIFTCSSGKQGSETPTGTFTVSQRGKSFYNSSINEGAYYWVRFYNSYLFHSVPFDSNGKIEQDEADKLGEPASHGCLRLSIDNAKWIYENIPEGTKVTIEQ